MTLFKTPSGAIVDDVTGKLIQPPPEQPIQPVTQPEPQGNLQDFSAALAQGQTDQALKAYQQPVQPTPPVQATQPIQPPVQATPPVVVQPGQTPQSAPTVTQPQGNLQAFSSSLAQGATSEQALQAYQRPVGAPTNVGNSFIGNGVNQPLNTDPKNVTDFIKQISEAFGFPDIKKDLATLDNKYIDDVAEVNDNPWLTESIRQKETQKLKDKYDAKRNATIERLSLQKDMVGQAINVYYKERDLQEKQREFALTQQEKAVDNAREAMRLQLEATKGFELSPGQTRYEFNPNTGQYEAVAAMAKDTSGGLTNVQIDNGRAISTSFENSPIVKNYIEIQNKFLNAKQYTGRGDGATDIATIYDLMKVLDPTSVVRNEEYATGAAKSGNIFAGGLAYLNGLIDPRGGFVSPQAKANIFRVIEDRYNTAKTVYENLRTQKQSQINQVAPGYRLTDYNVPIPPEQPMSSQEWQTNLDEDIKSIGESLGTRENLITELIKDYDKANGGYFTTKQIEDRVYALIPNK